MDSQNTHRTTPENLYPVDIEVLGDCPMFSTEQDAWVEELQTLLPEKDLMEWAESSPSTLSMGSPLPWPDSPVDEMKEANAQELQAAIVEADKVHERTYGTDTRVLDLLCNETEVDVRLGMWRADRFIALRQRVFECFDLYNTGWYYETIAMARGLIGDHDTCGELCDPGVYKMLQASEAFVWDKCNSASPWEGVVGDTG
ncbi:hypothetical protein T484DRAFT_1756354 [Baffinella frigidus]|nr:hypothetical protein T484DRAFT_1756354 [Cryptophyta sp. CCMP2293]